MDESELVPLTGAGWLAAAMAPWAVSPHPNFGTDDVDGPGLLALISEYRGDELDRLLEKAAETLPGWASHLVAMSKASVDPSTQHSAADSLAQIARNLELAAGARAAASFFAAIALVETERNEQAVELLGQVLDGLRAEAENSTPSSSANLVTRAVELQLSMRLVELGRPQEARELIAELSREWTPSLNTFETFRVSSGISWDARQVQVDIADAIVAHAIRLKARIEGFEGSTWMDVVRSRPVWIDTRIDWRDGERDNRFRKRAFEDQSPINFNRVNFAGEIIPGIRAAVGGLLLSELSADFGEVLANRQALAQMLVLGREAMAGKDRESNMAEALRLMRHAANKEGLATAIAVARADGPVDALVTASRVVIDRPSFPDRCSVFDVRLLEGTSDLIAGVDASIALRAVQLFLDREPQRGSFEDVRLGIRASAAFIAAAGETDGIAKSVLNVIDRTGTPPFSIGSDLIRFVEAVEWQDVQTATLQLWTNWAEGLLTDSGTEDLGRQILTTIGVEPPEKTSDVVTDNSIVDFIIRYADSPPPPDATRPIVEHCLTSLTELVSDAHAGHRSMYARDPGELAVFVAIRTGDVSLWSAIVSVLADMAVSADHKAGLVERLALNAKALPDIVVRGIADCAESLVDQARSVTPMAFDLRSPFPEGLRLVSAVGAISAEDLLPKVTAMAGDRTASVRREACETIPFVIGGTKSADWGQVLLIQLSRDADSVVRGDAIRGLVETLPQPGNLTTAASQRVLEVLDSTSIRMPLFALYGFQALKGNESSASVLDEFDEAIRHLAHDHPSSTVRRAAGLVLSSDEIGD